MEGINYEEFEYSEEDLELTQEEYNYIDDIMLHENSEEDILNSSEYINEKLDNKIEQIDKEQIVGFIEKKVKNTQNVTKEVNDIEKIEEVTELTTSIYLNINKYIKENTDSSKNYIEEHISILTNHLKTKYPKLNSKKEIGFRLWDFEDSKVLNLLLFNNKIIIEESGFLSYYLNISKTKEVFTYLTLDNTDKLFYILEYKYSYLYNIINILEERNENLLEYKDNTDIEETIEDFKDENEYISLNIEEYELKLNNVKGLIIHYRLFKLLNLIEYKKITKNYFLVELNLELINKIRKSKYFNYIYKEREYINYDGANILDEFYTKTLEEIYKENNETISTTLSQIECAKKLKL